MPISLSGLRKELRGLADPARARALFRFFKTGKGEYGEGDIFLGITVPQTRKVAEKYRDLSWRETETLLKSKIHEERLLAVLLLVSKFERAGDADRKKVFDFYLKHTPRINNWDLVDLSAPKIVGAYLLRRPRGVLYKLARSKNIWERRISILAAFAFIKADDFKDALALAKVLICDRHDLIHKAVGWMLREVGKRSRSAEEDFLRRHSHVMPRTMLRYAIERFPENLRQKYL